MAPLGHHRLRTAAERCGNPGTAAGLGRLGVVGNDGRFPRDRAWHEVSVLPPPTFVDLNGKPSPQITLYAPAQYDVILVIGAGLVLPDGPMDAYLGAAQAAQAAGAARIETYGPIDIR